MAGKVKKLDGFAAVMSDDRGQPEDIVEPTGLSASDLVDLRAFAKSGWQIVPQDQSGSEQRRVYRDGAGHVLIEGRYLTLRTNSGVTPEDAEQIANDHGLAIHRTLGLRRNMFQVEPIRTGAERPDPLEICAELEEDDRVKWADPSFIEAIGHRGDEPTEDK